MINIIDMGNIYKLAPMNPYEILGVPEAISESELKIQYKKLARKHHPDLGGDEERMKQINVAYDLLLKNFEFGYHYYPPRSPSPSSRSVDEAIEIIDAVIEIQQYLGHKKGWVYYQVIESASHLTLRVSDFEYMANKLEYQLAWADIKYQQYQAKKR